MRISRWRFWRRGGVVTPISGGTYVVEAEIHRTEELRPELLGVPSEDELDDRPHDPWRPAKTLGRLPKY